MKLQRPSIRQIFLSQAFQVSGSANSQLASAFVNFCEQFRIERNQDFSFHRRDGLEWPEKTQYYFVDGGYLNDIYLDCMKHRKSKKRVVALTIDKDLVPEINKRAEQLRRNRSQYFQELAIADIKQGSKAA